MNSDIVDIYKFFAYDYDKGFARNVQTFKQTMPQRTILDYSVNDFIIEDSTDLFDNIIKYRFLELKGIEYDGN